MKAQSYRNLYRKPNTSKIDQTKLPDVSPLPRSGEAEDSLQSDVDINRINMEIDSESSKRGPGLEIVEET
jgi:hypothetical protein